MPGLITALTNPRMTGRRIRELGVGRLASDYLVNRARLPIGFVGQCLRAGRIGLAARSYLRSRKAARAFVEAHGNPLAIPERLGFVNVPAEALPEHAAALDHCKKVLSERSWLLDRFPNRYGINLLAEDGLTWSQHPLDLRPHDVLLDLAVHPALVAAAAQYLGEMPTLASIQIYCTTNRTVDEGNNLYHFDKDWRQVKFWMAVDAIEDASGPFTFIDAEKSKIVRSKAGYYGRLTDESVYSAVSPQARIEFKGPAGSMLLVDTSRCVHFGSRTRKGPRVMLLIQYQSPYAWFEQVFYYQNVIFNRERFQEPVARMVFSQMRERVPGKR